MIPPIVTILFFCISRWKGRKEERGNEGIAFVCFANGHGVQTAWTTGK
jgi:hypothetical protein